MLGIFSSDRFHAVIARKAQIRNFVVNIEAETT